MPVTGVALGPIEAAATTEAPENRCEHCCRILPEEPVYWSDDLAYCSEICLALGDLHKRLMELHQLLVAQRREHYTIIQGYHRALAWVIVGLGCLVILVLMERLL